MANNIKAVAWAMRYHKVVFLVTALLLIAGIGGLLYMPKQEYPTVTINQGIIAGIYPGANSEQVAKQLTKPLEEHLFKYKEVKRKATYSQSKDGIVYVYITLNDNVKNKDEVWAKIRHGLNELKQELPPEVLALIVDSDFGETSALLFSVESESKTYRQLEGYMEQIESRLRQVPEVSKLTKSGQQKERIAIYLDKGKMAKNGIQAQQIGEVLYTQGLKGYAGDIDNGDMSIPIYLNTANQTEQNIANQIIRGDGQTDILRLKDIANVIREYPAPDDFIKNNGKKCLLMSVEMQTGNDITRFGKELNSILLEEGAKLPADVKISTIVDQSKVVQKSVDEFLVEMLIAIISVVLVTVFFMPVRVAAVAATSIPITIFISLGIMYAAGFELNVVTFAALIVVLGLIVDDCIVIVDSYIEHLDEGMSRWHASIAGAGEYFKSLVSATLIISVTFFPFLITLKGPNRDFMFSYPWTLTITLFVSLAVALFIIPFMQYILIKKGLHKDKKDTKKSFLDRIQLGYDKILPVFFKRPVLTMSILFASVVLAMLMLGNAKMRMMPIAERDLFAVEIYLPQGNSLVQTEKVADSLEKILKKDDRVLSITSFIGASSPRFHSGYSPNMPSKNYAQFIVNTKSNKATEELLNEYADKYAFHFPRAYVFFKQLDNEVVRYPIEVRLTGADEATLKSMSKELIRDLSKMDEFLWVHNDVENPSSSVQINIDQQLANRQGISNNSVAQELGVINKGIDITNVWENDYKMNVTLRGEIDSLQELNRVGNIYVPNMAGVSVPLNQVSEVSPAWRDGQINTRNGIYTISVLADLKRNVNPNDIFPNVSNQVDSLLKKEEYKNVEVKYGGVSESNEESIPQTLLALLIAVFIIYFVLVFHYKKISLANLTLASTVLCFFGAAFGIWVTGFEFGMTSVLGFVCLIGIVMRNGIILFDYADKLRKTEKMTVKEAALEAGRRRMRPIVLTSVAASVGVITMLVVGSPLWGPMAAIICFGALFSMVFILTILPVSYWLVYRKQDTKIIK
ncbi:efflux RND transporter permease subunit [Flavobacterium branchiarum]|uniref:Efflux RND transporter permease subunit n=1 Tax=Flavobacterium branchiarum TaxID=1114870 RepID=A0ABV5FNK6_9FLAO|nr:efflux RND transporter permease subunit [Flavobacterium branchiarum]MDN3671994.1 efflux RND transporter permease subunit [Flavobacterium branchiarum]